MPQPLPTLALPHYELAVGERRVSVPCEDVHDDAATGWSVEATSPTRKAMLSNSDFREEFLTNPRPADQAKSAGKRLLGAKLNREAAWGTSRVGGVVGNPEQERLAAATVLASCSTQADLAELMRTGLHAVSTKQAAVDLLDRVLAAGREVGLPELDGEGIETMRERVRAGQADPWELAAKYATQLAQQDKKRRKLLKRLGEIQVLKESRAAGAELEANQLEKLGTEDEVQAALELLPGTHQTGLRVFRPFSVIFGFWAILGPFWG